LAVSEIPETRYAEMRDGSRVGYQISGDGDLDLLFLSGVGGTVELHWELPAFSRVLSRLGQFSRLVRFDRRGSGISDSLATGDEPSLEERAEELVTVLDAAAAERAALVAAGPDGLVAMFSAASYPDRISALVLHGCYARFEYAPDYPWGAPREVLEKAVADVESRDDPAASMGLTYTAPNALKDTDFVKQWARMTRSAGGPSRSRSSAEARVFSDVRPALPAIQSPTLVMYRKGDRFAGKPHAQYLADHIARAKLVERPGADNLLFVGDTEGDLDEIEEFLTGTPHVPDADRVLATVLFCDIVNSTGHAAELGDRRWRELLERHDQAVRRQLARFTGREIATRGDGFLVTFDGPGRAIHCSFAIRDTVRSLGLEVRIGLHTGEIELRGDDVAGMAVHIGARVASSANPGQILVSSAVPPLMVGSNFEFDDLGERELKGVPGSWRLYEVAG
jgi:class 3 adenylate cyclase